MQIKVGDEAAKGATAMQSIVINLDQLKSLMLEFVAARGGSVDDENLLRRLTLSDFLLYLHQRKERDEQTSTPGIPSIKTN